jgi:hypothetical protein
MFTPNMVLGSSPFSDTHMATQTFDNLRQHGLKPFKASQAKRLNSILQYSASTCTDVTVASQILRTAGGFGGGFGHAWPCLKQWQWSAMISIDLPWVESFTQVLLERFGILTKVALSSMPNVKKPLRSSVDRLRLGNEFLNQDRSEHLNFWNSDRQNPAEER